MVPQCTYSLLYNIRDVQARIQDLTQGGARCIKRENFTKKRKKGKFLDRAYRAKKIVLNGFFLILSRMFLETGEKFGLLS